jgi:anti-sigma B factor antagonist
MSTSVDPDRGPRPLDSDVLHPPAALTHQVEVKRDRDRMLVCPAGEVDLATADTLEGRIVDLLEDGGCERAVVDLRAVTFIDSSGIRAILNAHRRARASGRSISILLGSPAIRRKFEIVGVTDYLEIEPDPSDGTP